MFGHGAQVRAVKRPSGTNWRPDGPSRLAGNAMAVLSTPFDPYYRKPMATLEDMRGQPMAVSRRRAVALASQSSPSPCVAVVATRRPAPATDTPHALPHS